MDVDLVLGVLGVYCGQMCVLTIKVCAPTIMDSGRCVGGTSRGLGDGCSWKAGRLALQGW